MSTEDATIDLLNLLRDAQREIGQLRRQNEILAAKVEVFDSMMCLLHTQPASRPMGATIDVKWQIQQKISELEASLGAKPS